MHPPHADGSLRLARRPPALRSPWHLLLAQAERGTLIGEGVVIMTTGLVSDKGQLTIPIDARRKLGIQPRSRVEIIVGDNEITIRPLKSIRELRGIFRAYAEGKSSDWDTIREETMKRVAREVASE